MKQFFLALLSLISLTVSAQQPVNRDNTNGQQVNIFNGTIEAKGIKVPDAEDLLIWDTRDSLGLQRIKEGNLESHNGNDWVRLSGNTQFPYNYIAYNQTLLQGRPDKWDAIFRETGNMLIVNGRHILFYSAHTVPYTQGTNEYVGMIFSNDGGATWQRGGTDGKLELGINCEDPFCIYNKFEEKYYLYVEHKSTSVPSAHLGIHLFTSTDLTNWVDKGLVLEPDAGIPTETQDVSSPTGYFDEDSRVTYLFYEGRSSGTNQGTIGLATAPDGETFTRSINNPILYGQEWDPVNPNMDWFTHGVPDDIKKIGNKFYFSLHCYNGVSFSPALFEAYELDTNDWVNSISTWVTREDDINGGAFTYYEYNGRIRGVHEITDRIVISDFTSNSRTKWKYTVKTTATGVGKLILGNQNQIIDAQITTNRTFELSRTFKSNAGAIMEIFNNSIYTLTIDPDTGNTINGLTSNITIPAGARLTLTCTGTDTFISHANATTTYVDSKIVQTITNGDTEHAPSADKIFDDIALKAPSTGSPNYIQNGTSAQTANLNITGSATTGSVVTGQFAAASAVLASTKAYVNTGNASVVGLRVRGVTSQSANLAEFQNVGGTPLSWFAPDGSLTSPSYKLSSLNTAPSSASDTGTTGEIRITADYIFICTATNTWKRVAISTW